MNQPRQFASLFAFQARLSSYLWFIAIFVLLIPAFLTHSPSLNDHETLGSFLNTQNAFLVSILGLWILAPEMTLTRWTNAASPMPNSEFFLILAVDRRIFYRSRATLFYLFVLLAPTIILLMALRSPDLTVTEYEKQARLACLHSVSGSTLQPDPSGSTSPLLRLPAGNILVGEWHFWMFMAIALISQAGFCFLFPLKRRLALFYTLFLGLNFVPLLITLVRISRGPRDVDFFPLTERLFFLFAGHQLIFWLASAAIFIAMQLWCEERFIRQQY